MLTTRISDSQMRSNYCRFTLDPVCIDSRGATRTIPSYCESNERAIPIRHLLAQFSRSAEVPVTLPPARKNAVNEPTTLQSECLNQWKWKCVVILFLPWLSGLESGRHGSVYNDSRRRVHYMSAWQNTVKTAAWKWWIDVTHLCITICLI